MGRLRSAYERLAALDCIRVVFAEDLDMPEHTCSSADLALIQGAYSLKEKFISSIPLSSLSDGHASITSLVLQKLAELCVLTRDLKVENFEQVLECNIICCSIIHDRWKRCCVEAKSCAVSLDLKAFMKHAFSLLLMETHFKSSLVKVLQS